jgi:DNA-directed RNA polymerase omega subunit
MSDVPIERLLPRANNSIYKLVSMAAARALELSDGKRCLAENIDTEKFTTMALQEILQGKIEIKDAKASKAEASQAAEEVKADIKEA